MQKDVVKKRRREKKSFLGAGLILNGDKKGDTYFISSNMSAKKRSEMNFVSRTLQLSHSCIRKLGADIFPFCCTLQMKSLTVSVKDSAPLIARRNGHSCDRSMTLSSLASAPLVRKNNEDQSADNGSLTGRIWPDCPGTV